jgi:hypothetical protein
MRALGKMLIAAVAQLLLAGCLWTPGKFSSELALRKGGAFVLDYRGEIMLQLPDDKNKDPVLVPWGNDMARCYVDGRAELGPGVIPVPIKPGEIGKIQSPTRPCSRAEIAKLKAEYEKRVAARAEEQRKEADQMAKMFGLLGSDDESNRRFAANLMKYKGWRLVAYRGKGVFDVDYHFEGRADQDFAFPMIPDSDLIVPFIALRRRNDGSVLVTAPGLTGGSGGPFGARAMAMGMPDADKGPASRAEGRFTVNTDGEILTNNSEDGPAAARIGTGAGKQVHWDVGPGSKKIPEMLVRL